MNYISETIKEFDEEFDWREIQYDGKMYVPTDNVKDFLQSKLEGLIDSIRGDIARYAGINDIQTKELIELLKEYK